MFLFDIGLMTCSSTYPCPVCLAKKGLLEQTGDQRTWEQIIMFCHRWRTETDENEQQRKDYFCCHNMPIIGGTENTSVLDKIVPPPLHITLGLNKPLKTLYKMWPGLADWFKSINVDHCAYHGGKDFGKLTPYALK